MVTWDTNVDAATGYDIAARIFNIDVDDDLVAIGREEFVVANTIEPDRYPNVACFDLNHFAVACTCECGCVLQCRHLFSLWIASRFS